MKKLIKKLKMRKGLNELKKNDMIKSFSTKKGVITIGLHENITQILVDEKNKTLNK